MLRLLCAAAASAAVAIAGWRWRPPPQRCGAVAPAGASATTPRRERSRRGLGPHPNRRPWSRASRRSATEIAGWCDDLSAALRSGRSLPTAIDDVDAAPALTEVVTAVRRDLRRGVSLGTAMQQRAPDDPDARFAWVIATAVADHGGPAAEPLDRAAAALRSRHAERVERATQSTTARSSARVMTALPLAMLLLLLATSAPVRDAVGTPIGATAIVGGVGLNLAGWLWMRRLLDRAMR